MGIALTSDTSKYDTLFLSNYAQLNIVNDLSRTPGVSLVRVFGQRQYAMRDLDRSDQVGAPGARPRRRGHRLARAECRDCQRKHRCGSRDEKPAVHLYRQRANTLSSPQQFANIILRSNPNGGFTRLGDVAGVNSAPKTIAPRYGLTATPKPWAWASCSIQPPTRCRFPTACWNEMNVSLQELPAGSALHGRLQHDRFRCGVGQRSHHHAAALHRAGRARDLRLPAEPAFDADSGGDDSGLANRNVLRHEDLRFYDQYDHALRPDAGHGASSSTTPSS